MTAYRQDALRCLAALDQGPLRAAEVARLTGVARAGALMRADHYGWFNRIATGTYAASVKGIEARSTHCDDIRSLTPPDRDIPGAPLQA